MNNDPTNAVELERTDPRFADLIVQLDLAWSASVIWGVLQSLAADLAGGCVHALGPGGRHLLIVGPEHAFSS